MRVPSISRADGPEPLALEPHVRRPSRATMRSTSSGRALVATSTSSWGTVEQGVAHGPADEVARCPAAARRPRQLLDGRVAIEERPQARRDGGHVSILPRNARLRVMNDRASARSSTRFGTVLRMRLCGRPGCDEPASRDVHVQQLPTDGVAPPPRPEPGVGRPPLPAPRRPLRRRPGAGSSTTAATSPG